LQESLQAMEITIIAAEREEMSAVQQLQNSQHFRQEALAQLEEIEARSRAVGEQCDTVHDSFGGAMPSRQGQGYHSGLAGSSSPRLISPDQVSSRLGFRPPHRGVSTGQIGFSSGVRGHPGPASTRRSGTDLHGIPEDLHKISEEGGEDEGQQ